MTNASVFVISELQNLVMHTESTSRLIGVLRTIKFCGLLVLTHPPREIRGKRSSHAGWNFESGGSYIFIFQRQWRLMFQRGKGSTFPFTPVRCNEYCVKLTFTRPNPFLINLAFVMGKYYQLRGKYLHVRVWRGRDAVQIRRKFSIPNRCQAIHTSEVRLYSLLKEAASEVLLYSACSVKFSPWLATVACCRLCTGQLWSSQTSPGNHSPCSFSSFALWWDFKTNTIGTCRLNISVRRRLSMTWQGSLIITLLFKIAFHNTR